MEINFLALIVAALSTLVVGFIWYNPKTFGGIWMRESGLTEEQLKGSNIVKTMILSVIFAFFIAFILQFLVIHQFGAVGMVGDPASTSESFATFMSEYGTAYRTFKHGALHGFMSGLLLALPLIATNALYERRSWKYTLVTGGFWIVCFTLMGGIICA